MMIFFSVSIRDQSLHNSLFPFGWQNSPSLFSLIPFIKVACDSISTVLFHIHELSRLGHVPLCLPGVCVKCNKAVYGANQACQAMGSLYHDSCFTCSACSKYSTDAAVVSLPFRTLTVLSSSVDSGLKLMTPPKRPPKPSSLELKGSTFLFSCAIAHTYLRITTLCCLVSGCASHSSSPHRRTEQSFNCCSSSIGQWNNFQYSHRKSLNSEYFYDFKDNISSSFVFFWYRWNEDEVVSVVSCF